MGKSESKDKKKKSYLENSEIFKLDQKQRFSIVLLSKKRRILYDYYYFFFFERHIDIKFTSILISTHSILIIDTIRTLCDLEEEIFNFRHDFDGGARIWAGNVASTKRGGAIVTQRRGGGTKVNGIEGRCRRYDCVCVRQEAYLIVCWQLFASTSGRAEESVREGERAAISICTAYKGTTPRTSIL